jgi:hypothetical protein
MWLVLLGMVVDGDEGVLEEGRAVWRRDERR